MTKPVIHQNVMYQLLHEERVEEFNRRRASGEEALLQGGDFRGIDLRNLVADGLDFSDAYFRGADLRGIDFRHTRLEGASLAEARISGCYFPPEFSPAELRLSLELGTRLRCRQH